MTSRSGLASPLGYDLGYDGGRMHFSFDNPRRSFALLIARAICWIVVWLPIPCVIGGAWFYGSLVSQHMPPRAIAVPDGDVPSRVFAAQGLPVGGLEHGRRAWVSYDALAPSLVGAVLASEDAHFFEHGGYSPRGIARAVLANRGAGQTVQGGSTITQQLAKSFVGDARTLERKLVELVVARRIEAAYRKQDIFEAYINRTYFGAGATGIGAAAEIFFGTTPDRLTLAQSATIAACIPAPGLTNPFQHPHVVLERRDRVLERMVITGFASRREADRARAEPLGLVQRHQSLVRAPEIERAALVELGSRDARRDWRYGGLAIHTGVDLVRQRTAQRAVRDALYALDQRQGQREHLAFVEPGELDAALAMLRGTHFGGEARPAIVVESGPSSLVVDDGHGPEALDVFAWRWAVPYEVSARNHGDELRRASDAFVPGDVVLTRQMQEGRTRAVVQFPRVEAAYGAADILDGTLEAFVGGFDADRSEFDRYRVGCRQPGSTFKPILYSAALDGPYTPATMIRDAPIRIELGPFEEWRPRNADGGFDGHMTVWQAFVWSRNLPAIAVYRQLGAELVIRRARALGLTTRLDRVESLALGASCTIPDELLGVYAIFARGGLGMDRRVVTHVVEQQDHMILSLSPATRPGTLPSHRISRMWSTRSDVPQRAISRANAFQMSYLMRHVVTSGTGGELRRLPFPVAGKTGTSNLYDAWFAGFSAREVAVLWIGADSNTRPLGRGESGSQLAARAWGEALAHVDPTWALLPIQPYEIEMVDIEPTSGRLAARDRWSVSLPMLRGSAPRMEAPSRHELEVHQLDRVERQF